MFFLMNSIPSANDQKRSLWEQAHAEQAKLAEHYEPQPPRPYEDSTADKVIQFGLPLAGLLGAGTVGAGVNLGKRAVGAVGNALSKPLKSTLARTTANAKSVADVSQHAIPRSVTPGNRVYKLQPDGTSQVIQGKKPTPGVEKRRSARQQAHAQQQAQQPQTAQQAQPQPAQPPAPPQSAAPAAPTPTPPTPPSAAASIPSAAQQANQATPKHPFLPPPSAHTPKAPTTATAPHAPALPPPPTPTVQPASTPASLPVAPPHTPPVAPPQAQANSIPPATAVPPASVNQKSHTLDMPAVNPQNQTPAQQTSVQATTPPAKVSMTPSADYDPNAAAGRFHSIAPPPPPPKPKPQAKQNKQPMTTETFTPAQMQQMEQKRMAHTEMNKQSSLMFAKTADWKSNLANAAGSWASKFKNSFGRNAAGAAKTIPSANVQKPISQMAHGVSPTPMGSIPSANQQMPMAPRAGKPLREPQSFGRQQTQPYAQAPSQTTQPYAQSAQPQPNFTQSYGNSIPPSPKSPQAQSAPQQLSTNYPPDMPRAPRYGKPASTPPPMSNMSSHKDVSPQAFAQTQQMPSVQNQARGSSTPPTPYRQPTPSHSQGVADLVQQHMSGAATHPDLSATSRIPQSAQDNMAFVRQQVQQNQHIDPQMRQALANAPRAHIPQHLQETTPSLQPRAQRQSSLPQTAPVMEAVQPPSQSFRDAQEFVRQQVGQNPVLDSAAKQQFGVRPHGTPAPQILHGGTRYETPSALASKPYPAAELRHADYDAGKSHYIPNRQPHALSHAPAPGSHWDSTIDQRRAMYENQDYAAHQAQKAYNAKLRQASMPIPAQQVTPPPQLASPPSFAPPSTLQQRLSYHGVQTPQYLQKTSSAISMPSIGMPKAPAMPSVKLPKITQQAAPRSVEVPKPLSLTQQPSPMDRVTPEIAGASSKTASAIDKTAKYFGNGFGVTRHYDNSIASAPIPQSYQNRPTGYAAEGWDDSKPMQRHSAVMANGGSALMDFAGRPNPLDMGGLQFNEVFLSAPAANAPKSPDPLIQMMQSQQQQQGMGQEQGDPSNPEVQQQQESADQQQQPGAETDSSMSGAEQAKVSHAKRASGESIGGNIQELVGLGVLGVPAAYELIHGHPKPEDQESTFHRTMQSPTTKSLAEILGLGILAQPYATNLYHQLTAPKVASPKTASWGGAAMGAGAGLVGGLLAGSQAAYEDKDGNIVGPSASSIILPTLVGGAAGYGLGKWNQSRNKPHFDALERERKVLSKAEDLRRQANKITRPHIESDLDSIRETMRAKYKDKSSHLHSDDKPFLEVAHKHPTDDALTQKWHFDQGMKNDLRGAYADMDKNPYKRNWFSAPGALAAGIGTGALANRMGGGQQITITKEEMEKESAPGDIIKQKLDQADLGNTDKQKVIASVHKAIDDFSRTKSLFPAQRKQDLIRKLSVQHGVPHDVATDLADFVTNASNKNEMKYLVGGSLGDHDAFSKYKNAPAPKQKKPRDKSIPNAKKQPSKSNAGTPEPTQQVTNESNQPQPPQAQQTKKQESAPMRPPSMPVSSPSRSIPAASASLPTSSTMPSPQSKPIHVEQTAHTNPPTDDFLQAALGSTPPQPSAPPTSTNAQPTEDDLFREILEPAKTTKPVVAEQLKQKASAIHPAVSSEKAPATTTKPTQATPATSPAQKGSPFHYGYHAALPAALGAAYGTTRGYLNPAVREDSSEVNPLALGLGTAATTSLGGLAGQQLGNLLHYPNAGAAIGSILGGLGGHEALRRLM